MPGIANRDDFRPVPISSRGPAVPSRDGTTQKFSGRDGTTRKISGRDGTTRKISGRDDLESCRDGTSLSESHHIEKKKFFWILWNLKTNFTPKSELIKYKQSNKAKNLFFRLQFAINYSIQLLSKSKISRISGVNRQQGPLKVQEPWSLVLKFSEFRPHYFHFTLWWHKC